MNRKPRLRHRLLLHGDKSADGRYFCGICDRFVQPEHFDAHGALNTERHRHCMAALGRLGLYARVIRGSGANLFCTRI